MKEKAGNARSRRRVPTPDIAAQRYDHGTRARYVFGKCRCFKCKVANADYVTEHAAQRRKPFRIRFIQELRVYTVVKIDGNEIVFRSSDREAAQRTRDKLNRGHAETDSSELVSTARARKHIRWLKSQGVGTNAISNHTGLSRGNVVRIARGEQRARRATVDRILAVTPDAALPGATVIDAAPTWKLLDELIALGHTKSGLARLLGSTAKTPALQFNRKTITLEKAKIVRRLHRFLIAQAQAVAVAAPPPAPTPQEGLAARLRSMDADEFAVRVSRFRDVRTGGTA